MKIYKNVDMKEYSNMRVGGEARELIEIEGKSELSSIIGSRERVYLIGNGTNTLFADGELDYSFITLKKLNKIELLDNNRVAVGAGAKFNDMISFMEKENLSGLEKLAGIPGSVGGLIYMNGGSFGAEIFDCIESVEVLNEVGELVTLKKEEIVHSYRHTEIQDKKWIIVEAIFKFTLGFDREAVKEYVGKRKEKHPLNLPNLGSTFKNPLGEFAVKYIISAGLRGYKIGGAQVSEKHPNFVVNSGSATFEDVINLIEYVKVKVKENSGVELQEEIRIVR